ncbi:MAG: DNA mismatch repair endonuclease MutL [Balneolaceae bacterium]|nr:DNA mismatch repair endonuclease MutL [Balneolaceae bacterium]
MSEKTDTSQSIIHQLPPEVSNKIAAGEVIQRPASVVKELLDNAIDAGADHIKIIIQNAGRTLIQVIDNGCGMGEEDIRLCFEQHATSKINSVEDLFEVRTLGFRGEAMASIASVAQVTLKSKRPEDEVGHEYEIWGGEEKEMKPAAVDNGTSVAVRNLFYNVPARRQFLKTDATEFRHILKTIQQAVLGHPDIGFNVIADTDEIYDLRSQPADERAYCCNVR